VKLSQTKTSQRFAMLQVAESGHGKTFRAASATRFGPVKFIDADNKLTGLRTRLTAEQQDLIEVEIPTTYDAIMKSVIETDAKKYATIVIDTWSRVHDLTIEKHKGINPKVATLELRDWGQIKMLNKQLLNAILSFKGNVIINAHVGRDRNAADQVILTVGTTGSFGAEIPQYMSETHYLYFDNKYRVKAARTNQIVANTSLPEKFVDATGNFIATDLSIFDEIAYKLT